MKSVFLKTICSMSDARSNLIKSGKPGDNWDASVQIRKVNNIPDNVPDVEVLRFFNQTADFTGCGTPKRYEFDFYELGAGKIMR